MVRVYNSISHVWKESTIKRRVRSAWNYTPAYICDNNVWKPAYRIQNDIFGAGVKWEYDYDPEQEPTPVLMGYMHKEYDVPVLDISGDKYDEPRPYSPSLNKVPFSPFDFIAPWCDVKPIGNPYGIGELISIPKFYYKWEKEVISETNGSISLHIVDKDHADDALIEGYKVSPAHAVRMDGGDEADEIYVARYLSAGTNGISVSGQTIYNYPLYEQISKGQGSIDGHVWGYDLALHYTISMLALVEYSSWNPYTKIGNAVGNVNQTGATDSMPFHTGVTSNGRMQYRGIEDLWCNDGTFINGIYRRSDEAQSPIYGANDPNTYRYLTENYFDITKVHKIVNETSSVQYDNSKEVWSMDLPSAIPMFDYFVFPSELSDPQTGMGIPYAISDDSEWFLMGYVNNAINNSTFGYKGIPSMAAYNAGAHRRWQYLPHVSRNYT